MARADHLAIVQRYLAAIDADDEDGLMALRAPGYVCAFPQSGERIRGPDAAVALIAARPSRPAYGPPIAITSLGPDTCVVELPAAYDGQPWWLVARLEVDDGRISREVAYFGEAFAAPDYRAAIVERYEPTREPLDLGEPRPDDGVSRDRVAALGRTFEASDLPSLARYLAPDWLGEYPQSGERFIGGDALLRAHDPYPGGLPSERLIEVAGPAETFAVTPLLPVLVHGQGACWMIELVNDYPDGSRMFQVAVLRYRAGLVHRTRWYWCPPFDAAAWRTGLVERYDPIASGLDRP